MKHKKQFENLGSAYNLKIDNIYYGNFGWKTPTINENGGKLLIGNFPKFGKLAKSKKLSVLKLVKGGV